jgi:two-component system OmpR family sensor kinase
VLFKLGMLRVRLALVIGTSFGFVLFLGLVLYWGSQKVALYFYRSQAAYEAFDRYERLSEEAYRHFKQRMDLLLIDSAATGTDVELSRQRLFDAIGQVRDSISKETDTAIDAEDRERQSIEPERVASLTAFLEAGMYRFDEVEQLRQQGKREAAMLLLSRFLEEEIDRKFEPLIDTAISGERTQALMARDRMSALLGQLHQVAIAAAAVAAFFSLTAGFFLFRGIKRPIEALMRGTDEIAAGNLAYRIPVESRNEFGYLAGHFNQMAGELETQRDKLREAQAALEHKVAERTLELNKLNRELQRLDQARREFFADISHELRTPITVIRGEAEVTLRGKDLDAEEYRDTLQRIQELSMQLGKLVNDLLFLARAETANLQFEWETLDLAELVAGAAEDLEVLAREKSIAVSHSAPAGPLWIRGDRQRLRQVLFILGDNACRYSNAGGRIDVALEADGTCARLSIEDQGIGIPAGDLESIFERYFRSTNARSGVDGTGLGLPMAKAIIQAHHGQITAASTEGVGTTFTVVLPRLN